MEAQMQVLNGLIKMAKGPDGCSSCKQSAIIDLRKIIKRSIDELGLPSQEIPGGEFDKKN